MAPGVHQMTLVYHITFKMSKLMGNGLRIGGSLAGNWAPQAVGSDSSLPDVEKSNSDRVTFHGDLPHHALVYQINDCHFINRIAPIRVITWIPHVGLCPIRRDGETIYPIESTRCPGAKIYPDSTASDVPWAINIEHGKLVRVWIYGYHVGPATIGAESDGLLRSWKTSHPPCLDHVAWPIYSQDSDRIIPKVCHQSRFSIRRDCDIDRDITCSSYLSCLGKLTIFRVQVEKQYFFIFSVYHKNRLPIGSYSNCLGA